MGDADKIDTRWNYQYINNVFIHFFKNTLDYFADYLYPRFEWKVMATYDKAVEYLSKQIQYDRETDQPNRPAIILNPSGDFGFDETYGRLPYRWPNLAPGFVKRVYDPIYQDQNVTINVGFSRIQGELDFMALLPSFYEYVDFKVFLNLIFGGKDKWITPIILNSFIILPEDLYKFHYYNEYTGISYTINIPNLNERLIKSMNSSEMAYPCTIIPRYKLNSDSDGSERLGGTEKLPDWKLNFVLGYEVELPTFMILETDDTTYEKIKYNISYSSTYTQTDSNEFAPLERDVEEFQKYYYDSTGNPIFIDGTNSIELSNVSSEEMRLTTKMHLIHKTRYFHQITQAEQDSTENVVMTLPEVVTNPEFLIITGIYGPMSFGDHYTLSSDGMSITINKKYVKLIAGDVLELHYYETAAASDAG